MSDSSPTTAATVTTLRRRWSRERLAVTLVLVAALLGICLLALVMGNTWYTLDQVWRVVIGEQVPGASFTVGVLRIPRTAMGVLAGLAFGMAGVTFQTMLRNPLASPDVIGITSGAGAGAVVGILILHTSELVTSFLALVASIVVALLIYGLSFRGGVVGSRLILVGIGFSAFFTAIVSYVTMHAGAQWDQITLMRWFTGSLNGATWTLTIPLLVAVLVLGPLLAVLGRHLGGMRLGDDAATALGVPVQRVRLWTVIGAVGLIAFATSATGPVAFVSFLAGPIAARIIRPGASLLIPAGLIGALLVVGADLLGQFAFPSKLSVGVVTGALGAPYLLYLLIRSNRTGSSL